MAKVEAQLIAYEGKSVAAQQALAAAEEIQRKLDEAAMADGRGLTLVLMPD